ncbi:hypothetical protein VN97_g2747 [Penicillium thymicola]|uniref:Uncharacterized protein n=1 Tax=Penicillium thymicola TaxID=293382 RepID=A0AAI9XBY4_PENTH|nr:hypothetical protein VN97_g2747 [Penicillium thymicola]
MSTIPSTKMSCKISPRLTFNGRSTSIVGRGFSSWASLLQMLCLEKKICACCVQCAFRTQEYREICCQYPVKEGRYSPPSNRQKILFTPTSPRHPATEHRDGILDGR